MPIQRIWISSTAGLDGEGGYRVCKDIRKRLRNVRKNFFRQVAAATLRQLGRLR